MPLVELAARAPVHDDHAHPCGLGAAREIGGIQAIVVPAKTHFERDRQRDRLCDRLDQAQCQIGIAHQGGTGQPARDLFRRAAHVDVDDARAHPFDLTRGLAHDRGIAPGKLDRGCATFKPQLRPLQRAGARGQQFARGDHLADHEVGAKAGNEVAHRQIGDPGHGGQGDNRAVGWVGEGC